MESGDTEKAEEEDAAPQQYVASYNYIASGSDQVRQTRKTETTNNEVIARSQGVFRSLYVLLSNSLVSPAATRCSFTPSLHRSGGGQSCGGSKVMSPPVTYARAVMLKRRKTRPRRTLGKTRNTSAVIAHWWETWELHRNPVYDGQIIGSQSVSLYLWLKSSCWGLKLCWKVFYIVHFGRGSTWKCCQIGAARRRTVRPFSATASPWGTRRWWTSAVGLASSVSSVPSWRNLQW